MARRRVSGNADIRALDNLAQALADEAVLRQGIVYDDILSLGSQVQQAANLLLRSAAFLPDGRLDPSFPGNSQLALQFQNDLQGLAKLIGERAEIGMGEGAAQITNAAARIWGDSVISAEAVALGGLNESATRLKTAVDGARQSMFEAFQSALLVGADPDALLRQIAAITERTAGQAGQVVHDGLMSAYRQANVAAGNDAEVEYYWMSGPVDSRITQVCYEHVGEILTRADWLKIDPLVFLYGLHHRCRHSWLPVTPAMLRRMRADKYHQETGRYQMSGSARGIIAGIDEHGGDVDAWYAAGAKKAAA